MRVAWSMSFLLVVGCSAVSVPQENYYRLAAVGLPVALAPTKDTLRVEGFELASSLSRDQILVADNSVQLRAYEFHRWISPLNRLIQDTVATGLTRSKTFAQVKGPTDDPGETLALSGRVLEFQQEGESGKWQARVTIELRLQSAPERRLLLQDEFTAEVPMTESDPAAAVVALSSGVGRVVSSFLERCREAGLIAVAAGPSK